MSEGMTPLQKIREIARENNLIVMVFTKGDADGIVLDTDEKTDEDRLMNLTDAQWEYVRHNWDKSNSAVMEDIWILLEELCKDAKLYFPD